MSSYGSMSPSGEASPSYDRYEPQFFCTPQQMPQSSPLDNSIYWQGTNTTPSEYEPRDIYHDTTHYISRNYGYDEVQMTPPNSDPFSDPYQHHGLMMQQNLQNNNVVVECEPRSFPRAAAPAHTYVRVVKRRNTANRKERRRTQSINTAFSDLRECIPNVPADTKLSKERRRTQNVNTAFSDLRERIPNVPADTKLSKIKTLRLATSYISYLMRVLECDSEPAGGFRAELHHPPARRQRHQTPQRQHLEVSSGGEECKRSKGRTGWPQHVWALELKQEQNMQA